VEALRGAPPLTSAAERALKSWKFRPATLDGHSEAGTVRLVVVFNPSPPNYNSGNCPILRDNELLWLPRGRTPRERNCPPLPGCDPAP
jgi:hypothetical protein